MCCSRNVSPNPLGGVSGGRIGARGGHIRRKLVERIAARTRTLTRLHQMQNDTFLVSITL